MLLTYRRLLLSALKQVPKSLEADFQALRNLLQSAVRRGGWVCCYGQISALDAACGYKHKNRKHCRQYFPRHTFFHNKILAKNILIYFTLLWNKVQHTKAKSLKKLQNYNIIIKLY